MAMFRFELKTDTKKSTVGKISASRHIEYIDRLGRYKNIDKTERMENVITGPHLSIWEYNKEFLLHESHFVIIKRDDKRIKISSNASIQTIAAALLVAERYFDGSLQIGRTEKFKQAVVSAACSLELETSRSNFVILHP